MSDEVHNYKDVMYKLSNKLSKEEAQDIAMLNELEHTFHEERQFRIFVQLEQRQIICESSPEKLVQILRRIDRRDLAKEAERLNMLLKKSRKKNRGTTANNCAHQEPTPEWKSAEFAVARMHVEHLAASLMKLDPECDHEIKEAVDKLNGINKHLSRAERCRGLPPTARHYIKSLDMDDISTCSSSNNSENCFDAELAPGQPQCEEGPVYEAMTYGGGRPTHSHISVSTIDSRPPLPAPKPSRGQQCTAEEETCVSNTATPTPTHKIPLPGMVPTASVLQHRITPSNSPLLTPSTTRIAPIIEPLRDDSTGDSGMGTGSGEYGFNNVQRYLKVSPGPNKKPRPIPPPKPRSTEYMPLRTTHEPTDYTRVQTPRGNTTSTTEQIYYSTPKS